MRALCAISPLGAYPSIILPSARVTAWRHRVVVCVCMQRERGRGIDEGHIGLDLERRRDQRRQYRGVGWPDNRARHDERRRGDELNHGSVEYERARDLEQLDRRGQLER